MIQTDMSFQFRRLQFSMKLTFALPMNKTTKLVNMCVKFTEIQNFFHIGKFMYRASVYENQLIFCMSSIRHHLKYRISKIMAKIFSLNDQIKLNIIIAIINNIM